MSNRAEQPIEFPCWVMQMLNDFGRCHEIVLIRPDVLIWGIEHVIEVDVHH